VDLYTLVHIGKSGGGFQKFFLTPLRDVIFIFFCNLNWSGVHVLVFLLSTAVVFFFHLAKKKFSFFKAKTFSLSEDFGLYGER
jgi:hypothetical protein